MVGYMGNNENAPRQSANFYLRKMDAIAAGVQERLKETGNTRSVTDETVNIARSLGLPDSEIEKWIAYRLGRLSKDVEYFREIKSLLDKSSHP